MNFYRSTVNELPVFQSYQISQEIFGKIQIDNIRKVGTCTETSTCCYCSVSSFFKWWFVA